MGRTNARPMTGSAKQSIARLGGEEARLRPSAFALRARADRSADCPTGKSVNCCLPPFAKIFLFRLYPNHFYIHRRLAPLQGRIAIVTDAGRDAVDAAASGV